MLSGAEGNTKLGKHNAFGSAEAVDCDLRPFPWTRAPSTTTIWEHREEERETTSRAAATVRPGPTAARALLLPKQKPACPDLTFGLCFFFLWLCLLRNNNNYYYYKKISSFLKFFLQILYTYRFLFIGSFLRRSIFKAVTVAPLCNPGQYLLSSQPIIAFSRCKHYCSLIYLIYTSSKTKGYFSFFIL